VPRDTAAAGIDRCTPSWELLGRSAAQDLAEFYVRIPACTDRCKLYLGAAWVRGSASGDTAGEAVTCGRSAGYLKSPRYVQDSDSIAKRLLPLSRQVPVLVGAAGRSARLQGAAGAGAARQRRHAAARHRRASRVGHPGEMLLQRGTTAAAEGCLPMLQAWRSER